MGNRYEFQLKQGHTLSQRRVLVNSWVGSEGKSPMMFNFLFRTEFLISKRVSFFINAGYLLSTDFIPDVYETGGNRNWSDDVDTNGKFQEYNNFNFARRDVDGKRVSMNFSGFNAGAGAAIHF